MEDVSVIFQALLSLGFNVSISIGIIFSLNTALLQVVAIGTRHRKRNRCRNRDYGLHEMDVLAEQHPEQFKRMFRMSPEAFNILLEKVSDHLGDLYENDTHHIYASNSSGSLISNKTKLAATLRWLAGGSYIDICFEFGIGYGSFYQDDGVLWGTMIAIDRAFDIAFPFEDDAELKRMADGFSYYSHGHMANCVMAIDGWVCRTRQPYATEVEFPSSYRNRHECFGLVVLAGCDANKKFRMLSCKSSGSTNDVVAWDISLVKNMIDDGNLPRKYYIVGDEAFCNTGQVLVPWSGRGLDTWKDSFNFHLSSMRQNIECAFGILTQRWGIFWRPLRCSFNRWTLVITVCAKLHNFCIDMGEGRGNDVPMRVNEDHETGDRNVLYDNGNDDDVILARPIGDTRRIITEQFGSSGQRRPPHAYRRI
jgi:hypothetical protein